MQQEAKRSAAVHTLAARPDFKDIIARIQKLRIRNGFDTHITRPMPTSRFHGSLFHFRHFACPDIKFGRITQLSSGRLSDRRGDFTGLQ